MVDAAYVFDAEEYPAWPKVGSCFGCLGHSNALNNINLWPECAAWGRECMVLGLGRRGWVGCGGMWGRVIRFYQLCLESDGASYFDFI